MRHANGRSDQRDTRSGLSLRPPGNRTGDVCRGSDENALNARYYLRDMVSAMKDQGFRNVFTDTTLPKNHAPIKMTITLDVESKQVTYRYTATEYGQVANSTTTQCKKNKKRPIN